MCLYDTYVPRFLGGKKDGIGSLGTKLKDSCEPLFGFWELNSDPIQDQVLLTSDHHSSPYFLFLIHSDPILS